MQARDLVKVTVGSKFPCDCCVVKGRGLCDESLLTGESLPVLKQENDEALAGTILTDGMVYARVLRVRIRVYVCIYVCIFCCAKTRKRRGACGLYGQVEWCMHVCYGCVYVYMCCVCVKSACSKARK